MTNFEYEVVVNGFRIFGVSSSPELAMKEAGRIISESQFNGVGDAAVERITITKSNNDSKGQLKMKDDEMQSCRERFDSILKSTGRSGIDRVIECLEKVGFYTAPASSKFHCSEDGGLLKHSLNVYDQAMKIRDIEVGIRPEMADRLTEQSIAIAALLHDVCKSDIYRKVDKFRKDAEGKWEKYETYDVDHSKMPLGHGEKSVIRLLRMGLSMTNDEILAIRWHMGAWDLSEYSDARQGFNSACENAPLLPVLMAADGLATRITEHEESK